MIESRVCLFCCYYSETALLAPSQIQKRSKLNSVKKNVVKGKKYLMGSGQQQFSSGFPRTVSWETKMPPYCQKTKQMRINSGAVRRDKMEVPSVYNTGRHSTMLMNHSIQSHRGCRSKKKQNSYLYTNLYLIYI